MKVADVRIVLENFMSSIQYVVGFSDADKAKAEYARIAGYLIARADHKNDLPRTIEIIGIERVTVPLDKIVSVGYADFRELDEHEAGVKDTFPHLFKS